LECVTHEKPDGTPCDDGDEATYGDQCEAGACAGKPLYCESGICCGGEPGGNLLDDTPMCAVAAGEFLMGSTQKECDAWEDYFVPPDPDCPPPSEPNPDPDDECTPKGYNIDFIEQPAHDVYLSAYLIDRTAILASQYQKCMDQGSCTPPDLDPLPKQCTLYPGGAADLPVNCVDWYQLNAYCEWAGKRLCTEAEWEKAARGEAHLVWPWGNQWCSDCSNTYEPADVDGYDGVAPVGSYPQGASPYGLVDMGSNLMEFVADWFSAGYYQDSPPENPLGPCDGLEPCDIMNLPLRVLRGCSFREVSGTGLGAAHDSRTAIRSSYWAAGALYDDVGARCCESIE